MPGAKRPMPSGASATDHLPLLASIAGHPVGGMEKRLTQLGAFELWIPRHSATLAH